MQRYEKVRAEANGKRSFRHRRLRRGSRTAAFPFSRRPVLSACCLARLVRRPSLPASCPARYLSLCFPYPARPIRRPAPFGRVCCRRLRLVYRPVLFRPPPSPLPSPACPLPFPSFRPSPARRPTPVRFYLPPGRRSLRSSVLPSHSARRLPPPSSSFRPAPREGPGRIFCRYFIILQEFYTFAKRKNKIQKTYTYGKSL